MLHLLLLPSPDQGLSVTRLLTLAALLILGGCASIPKQHAEVNALLLGKPQSFATARLGQPDTLGGTKGRLVQYELRRGIGAGVTPVLSHVSGHVGLTPVSGTITTYQGYTYETYCTLMLQTDARGTIIWTRLDGQPDECRKGLKPLLDAGSA